MIVNAAQQLYIVNTGGAVSHLPFTACRERTLAISKEMNRPDLAPVPADFGTLAGYRKYQRAQLAAREQHERTGRRLTCALSPQLVGLEGKRVEAVTLTGEKRRFQVGKSTGWIPCHLELFDSRSKGGRPAEPAYKSVRVVVTR